MKPSDISVLVVDDEQMLLDVIYELFSGYGFSVDVASSGNMAWELLQKNKYKIVLSDIRMPDGGGMELIKKIKSQFKNEISVLFMTGFSDLQNEEVYHLGAEAKFAKPFDSKAVRSAIEQCLLTPYARWNSATPASNPKTLMIEKVGEDVDSLKAQKQIFFGKGGFFVAHNYAPPPKGTLVNFNFQIKSPTPLKFSGAGIVRWIQVPGRSIAPPGLGVEIVKMDEQSGKLYTNLFGNEIAYIPSFAFVGT